MKLTERNKGDLFIIMSSILWSIFPLITKYTYGSISPVSSLFFSTLFSIFLFLAIFLRKKEWKYFKEKKGWIYIIIIGLLNGLVVYSLIFYGLQFTSAINTSIISIGSEMFFAYLYFGFLFAEKRSSIHELLGAFLMLVGTVYIIFPGTFQFNKGDIFIVIATMITPLANKLTQKALTYFSTNFIMLIRAIITCICLGIYGLLFEKTIFFVRDINILFALIFSGIVLFGLSKLSFIEGLRHISIPRASSFAPLVPIFTIFFGFLFFSESPTTEQLLGLIPVSIGLFVFFDRIPFVKGSIIKRLKK